MALCARLTSLRSWGAPVLLGAALQGQVPRDSKEAAAEAQAF